MLKSLFYTFLSFCLFLLVWIGWVAYQSAPAHQSSSAFCSRFPPNASFINSPREVMNDAHEKEASRSSLFSSDRIYCTVDSCSRPEYLDMREFSGEITLTWKGFMNEWSCVLYLKNGIVTDTELDFYD